MLPELSSSGVSKPAEEECAISVTPSDDTHLAGEELRCARTDYRILPIPSDDAQLAGEEYRRARDGNDRRGSDYWKSTDTYRAGKRKAMTATEKADSRAALDLAEKRERQKKKRQLYLETAASVRVRKREEEAERAKRQRAKKETELPETHLECNICVCDLCQFRSDSRIRHFLQTIGIEHCLHALTAANITYEDLLLQSIPARKLRDAGFQPTDIVKLQSQLHTLREVVEDAMMIPIRACATCTGPADMWQGSTCENWLCDDCINECERCGCYSCHTHPCTCIGTNLRVNFVQLQ